jgi:archaellum component FlaG (FlaF/FlaG flagellin family)
VSHNRRVAAIAVGVRVYGDPIMRTTVGPLPSAVYWRRRAVVLGAVLLGIIVLFVSCSGNDKSDQRGKGGSSSSSLPTPAPARSSADAEPSFVDPVPGGGPALPDPSDLETQANGGGNTAAPTGPTLPVTTTTPAGGNGTNTNVTAPADGSCADSEMSVIPVPSATTVKRGAPVDLQLKIKNVGKRTCSRDVGADPQELYIDRGAFKYWSSDTCGTARGSDVRQFAPGAERVYKITWNGRQSSSCANGVASGPNPPAGQFELRGRLGTLVSNPVTLTVVA